MTADQQTYAAVECQWLDCKPAIFKKSTTSSIFCQC